MYSDLILIMEQIGLQINIIIIVNIFLIEANKNIVDKQCIE